MSLPPGLLERVERYFAAAPLPDARIEIAGGLDVPIGSPTWPYPARPRPAEPVSVEDVRAAVALQEAAGLPVAVEWVCEDAPTAEAAVRAAGLAVDFSPLLVAADPVDLLLPYGVRLYLVGADDPELPRYERLASIAFANPGPRSEAGGPTSGPAVGQAVGPAVGQAVGPAVGPAVGVALGSPRTAVLRERIATGRTVMMVAVEGGEPVAVGTHHPVDVDGAEITEIAGVATLPRLRGRGLGAGLASALTAHARETAELVFLVAGDDDVARVYERTGFARLATVGVADPSDGG